MRGVTVSGASTFGFVPYVQSCVPKILGPPWRLSMQRWRSLNFSEESVFPGTGESTTPKHRLGWQAQEDFFDEMTGEDGTSTPLSHEHPQRCTAMHAVKTSIALLVQAIAQYPRIWDMVESVTLREEEQDTIYWKMSKDGLFSASSADQMFFMAKVHFPRHRAIWKSKATSRCKFFMWLAVHRKCLTVETLRRRAWPCDSLCSLCHVEPEDCDHLFILCRFPGEVWGRLRSWSVVDFPM
ncbi:hypothetical protein D1007_36281 [Hordeum vulgare]|nr:hypothetical protein D1007_36281 [Hordeum vulgare]